MVFSLRSTLGQLQNTAMFFRLTLILRGQISYAALRGRPRPRIRLEPTQAEFDRMQREVTEERHPEHVGGGGREQDVLLAEATWALQLG